MRIKLYQIIEVSEGPISILQYCAIRNLALQMWEHNKSLPVS
jgi:hypothetical protein